MPGTTERMNAVEEEVEEQQQNEVEQQDGGDQTPSATTPHMSAREKALWAMSFEDLYAHAFRRGFGRRDKESRKSGRVRIIKWVLQKEGIVPFKVATTANSSAQSTPPVQAQAQPARNDPSIRTKSGAIPHPEAIPMSTTDPDLQRQIVLRKREYMNWGQADLVPLAMQRSYQLFKDSQGKMPPRAKEALADWLAAWDVLKPEREKQWWLGDGIDLVNKAKAMGYEGHGGPANAAIKKYDVICWLRETPEGAELEVGEVAEPTPNKRKRKRKGKVADDYSDEEGEEGEGDAEKTKKTAVVPKSKRPAKGSTRIGGWDPGFTTFKRSLKERKR